MQKTRVEKEKQGKLLSVLAALDAQALQGVLEGHGMGSAARAYARRTGR